MSDSTPAVAASAIRRGRWKRLALWTLLALLLLGVIAEAVLRILGYASFVDFQPDPALLWLPVPGVNRLTVVRHQRITISHDRFRYPKDLGPKAPGEKRIFVFGDSVTMGWGVDDESHYSAVLERILNAPGSRSTWRVISAGVNAYPNYLVAERLKSVVGGAYAPDVAILAYSFNTAMEGLPLLTGAERQRLLNRVALKSYLRHIALYNFVVEDVLRNLVYYRLRTLFIQGSWDTSQEHSAGMVRQFRDGMLECRRACESRGVKLVLLLLPSRNQKDQLHPQQQAMLDFACEQNVPLVNIVEAFHDRDHAALFMDHVHPNEAGHDLIAAQIAAALRRAGIRGN